MDKIKLFKLLGQIAGLGGVGFAIFFILSQQILKLEIFSAISSKDTYQLIQGMMIMSFLLAVIGACLYGYSIASKPRLDTVFSKYELLMRITEPPQTIHLIEEIANSTDPKKHEYLQAFSRSGNLSQIEGDTIQLALSSIKENKVIETTFKKLIDIKNNESKNMELNAKLLNVIVYRSRPDSEAYKASLKMITDAIKKRTNA
jgi:hypothetical protein